MKVDVRRRATNDIKDAATWYHEKASADRGRSFVELTYDQIDEIGLAPFRSAIASGDVRRCNLPVYPYGIYYRVADGLVTILAVRHHSRAPVDWNREP